MPKASKAAPTRKKAAPKSAAAVKAEKQPKSKVTPPVKTAAAKEQPTKSIGAGKPPPAATKATASAVKQPGGKAAGAKKAAPRAKKGAPKKAAAATTSKKSEPSATTKKAAAVAAASPAPAGGAAGVTGPGPVAKATPAAVDGKFLEEQRSLLLAERRAYEEQATALKAEADQLAAEMEPGDVQFDEESGEGDSIGMERERDLQLAGQARAAIEEIDRALAKVESGTYGMCERCNQPIPKARLKALPYAALCVACKSGGLTSRR